MQFHRIFTPPTPARPPAGTHARSPRTAALAAWLCAATLVGAPWAAQAQTPQAEDMTTQPAIATGDEDAYAPTNPAEQALLAMRRAFDKADQKTLAALLPVVQGHPLQGWAAYWELRSRLFTAGAHEVDAFLTRWQGTYQEDRLRNDWLLLLGQRRQWTDFERLHAGFRMRDDAQVKCYMLAIQALQDRLPAAAPQSLLHLWYGQPNADDGCNHAASELYARQHITALDVWKRARLAGELNRQTAVRNAVTIVAPQAVEQVAAIFKAPDKYLQAARGVRTAGKGTGKTGGKQATSAAAPVTTLSPVARQMVVLALIRLAVRDPVAAAAELQHHWAGLLHDEERDWAWGSIGKAGAQQLSDHAPGWFAHVSQPSALSDDTLGWMARAHMRAGQWHTVRRAIRAMSPTAQNSDVWLYWKARALLTTESGEAHRAQAHHLLQGLASANHYYGQLALETLGKHIVAPEEPTPPTGEEMARAQANPGLTRALHAIRLGLRSEGVREWNYTTSLHTPGGMGDRDLLAAAERACRARVWDRCINTSERTRSFASWQQRYPMPFKELVLPQARGIGLEAAYVYGLIRQESRFMLDARSHVGASGLMQIMPATARWTARKIGMLDFQPTMIYDRETNIALGTSYLKLALDDLDASLPLAAAGYNAGPNRPRRWRNGPLLEGAIWTENIPFSETRDYVKKVLANTTSYSALISGEPQSLLQRLGYVGPKTSSVPDNTELP